MLGIKNIELKAQHVFIAGMISIPAFLFQQSLYLKWTQVAFFILLSAVSGKRIRVLPNVLMMAGIICANSIPPVGKVLFTVLEFPVTSGALARGLERSALLIGMIYISRFALTKGLSLPGRMGNILALVFFYFERILAGEKLSKGNLIKKVDHRLMTVYKGAQEFPIAGRSESKTVAHTNVSGLLYLSIIVIANWMLFLFSLVHGHVH